MDVKILLTHRPLHRLVRRRRLHVVEIGEKRPAILFAQPGPAMEISRRRRAAALVDLRQRSPSHIHVDARGTPLECSRRIVPGGRATSDNPDALPPQPRKVDRLVGVSREIRPKRSVDCFGNVVASRSAPSGGEDDTACIR